MSVVLIEETNPHGTRVAALEDDGRTLYLYLSPVEKLEGETRAVWVRNLLEAPEKTDFAAMQSGHAPLLRREACNHPDGAPSLSAEEADLVWFPEGTGVALYHDGEALAIIPPWSGYDGLQGYARDALQSDMGTLPFPEDESRFHDRLQENLDFWTTRATPAHWAERRDALLTNYEQVYGKHAQYYALQDRAFPLIGVAEFSHGHRKLYASVGMSEQPMPGVERQTQTPEKLFRAELVVLANESHEWAPGLVARMALFPWLAETYVATGHTYESGLAHEESNFVFTDDFERLGIPAPPALLVDERYPINYLLAAPVPKDYLTVARVRGVDHVLQKIYPGG